MSRDAGAEVERLHPDDWQRLRTLRLRSIADAPDAFASTLAEIEALGESDWRQQLITLATYTAVVADADMGIARGVPDAANPDHAWLVSMWVAPEARGTGTGERLIQAVVAWASEAGYARLLLDVADSNQAAGRLYERMGFRRTGETGRLPPPREHVTEHQRAKELQPL